MNGVVAVRRFVCIAALILGCASALLGIGASAQSTSSHSKHKQASASKSKKKTSSRKKSSKRSPRLLRIKRAFVESTALKPMARQLLENRTPAAYAGVEKFARAHSTQDAGSLAWLVVGYAHVLDHDYAKAVDPLGRARPHAGDIGDYVNYYLATSYVQTGRSSQAVAVLSTFERDYPNSLLLRDARVQYANALLTEGRAQEALKLLEGDRQPTRSDVELAVGRAYEGVGQTQRAADIFRNLYFTMPISSEAPQANEELMKLASQGVTAPPSFRERKDRADLLAKARHYGDAAGEYRALVDIAPADQKPKLQVYLAEMLRQSGQNREAKKILDAMPDFTKDINAEKYFNLGEIARAVAVAGTA